MNYYGTNGNDIKDFLPYGNSNDMAFGYDGNDSIWGWYGNDALYGMNGNDKLYGEAGYDKLFGGTGNDTLSGGSYYDDLWGGTGADALYGGLDGGADYFYFYTGDTGDAWAGQADTIYDFQPGLDVIWLSGKYYYSGQDPAPKDGNFGIWQSGSDWVVTYNSPNDSGYHDIIVKGAHPDKFNDIAFF
jgi:Ca2+-binding RTX toxin-like protein